MILHQLIQTNELELEASLQSDTLSLVLFSFVDQLFYKGQFTTTTISKKVIMLYEEIAHFYHYLASRACVPKPSSYLRFENQILYIKDYICEGKSEIQCLLFLKLVDIQNRKQLMLKKIGRMNSDIKLHVEKWTRQVAITNQNKKIAKFIRQECKEKTVEQANIKARIAQIKLKMEEIQKKISRSKRTIKDNMNELQEQAKKQDRLFVISRRPTKLKLIFQDLNPYFKTFKRKENYILNDVDPLLFYSQMISKNPIPSYGIWNIRFKIITSKYGIAFGITGEQNKQKQHSFNESSTLCICTRNSSFYVNGFKSNCREWKLQAGAMIMLTINREESQMRFQLLHATNDRSEEILIPKKMRNQRQYFFLEMSHNDVIQLVDQ